MDNLTEALLLEILSRLDDSADVARCRLAWKTFDTLSADLRSINLQWPSMRYVDAMLSVLESSSSSQFTSPLKKIFLKLVSHMRVVESVCIGAGNLPLDLTNVDLDDYSDELYLTDDDFVKEWLPRVSGTLKSLSISDFWIHSCWRRSNVLSLVSAYCHKLVELEVKHVWFSIANLKPMPMLTSLTLDFIRLDDKNITMFSTCFPNLQVLKLISIRGLIQPTIDLLKLKTCYLTITDSPLSITLTARKLTTLRLECLSPRSLCIEAPLLSDFHLALDHVNSLMTTCFDYLETLWLELIHIRSIFFMFPLSESVENLTLDSRDLPDIFTKFTLDHLFSRFPNLTYLCFKDLAWSEHRDFKDQYDCWGPLESGKGLKSFCGYFESVGPLCTFSKISSVMDQCVNLENVSLLIHRGEDADVSKYFISWCMACWPNVKWKWGEWEEGSEDSWITVDPKDYELKSDFEE